MITRRLLCLVLMVTLVLAHWGRAAMCHCQHTARQLPHIHLSELTFGILGKTDHSREHRRTCGCCRNCAPSPESEHSPANLEMPEDEDVIYLPTSLDHDWRIENSSDSASPSIDLVAGETLVIPSHPDFHHSSTDRFGDPPARLPLYLLTCALLI